MKLFTFCADSEISNISVGINTTRCLSLNMYKHHAKDVMNGEDYYVSIGNGNGSTGRLFIERGSLDLFDNKKLITNADIIHRNIFGGQIFYLKPENDLLNNTIFLLLKNIERIDNPFMKNGDDYLKILKPEEKISIVNFFDEEFIIHNKLNKTSNPCFIENNIGKIILKN